MAENFKNLMKDLKVTDSRSLVNNKKKLRESHAQPYQNQTIKLNMKEKKS